MKEEAAIAVTIVVAVAVADETAKKITSSTPCICLIKEDAQVHQFDRKTRNDRRTYCFYSTY